MPVPAGSPSSGGNVTVYVWHKPTELVHSLLCSWVCFCIYGPFNYISFHKFSRQFSVFSLSSSGLISALLVLSTIYLFMKVSFSPDIIHSGWLGSEHQLTKQLTLYAYLFKPLCVPSSQWSQWSVHPMVNAYYSLVCTQCEVEKIEDQNTPYQVWNPPLVYPILWQKGWWWWWWEIWARGRRGEGVVSIYRPQRMTRTIRRRSCFSVSVCLSLSVCLPVCLSLSRSLSQMAGKCP